MPDGVTFRGREGYRVRLEVLDIPALPGGDFEASLSFSVYTLPDSANRYTRFTHGTRVYYGDSFKRAWKWVERWVGYEPEMPKWLRKYAE